jgi:hypothetical protein
MSLETEPTRFVEADGIRFAYRAFGRKDGAIFQHHAMFAANALSFLAA